MNIRDRIGKKERLFLHELSTNTRDGTGKKSHYKNSKDPNFIFHSNLTRSSAIIEYFLTEVIISPVLADRLDPVDFVRDNYLTDVKYCCPEI